MPEAATATPPKETERIKADLPAKTDVPITRQLAQTIAGSPVIPIAEVRDKLRMLVYGVTGSGKTWLAGSACEVPEMCPILVLNIDGGTKTARTAFPKGDIHVVTPEERTVAGKQQHKWLHVEAMYEDLKLKKGGGYKTIVIDSLSESYELCMDWWLKNEYARDSKRDPDLPGAAGGQEDFGRDWNKARAIIRRVVRGFRDLNTHIIYTAHSAEVKSKTGPLTLDLPSFPGKLANEVPGFIDEVIYLYAREVGKDQATKEPIIERRVQCQPTDVRPSCKSRGNLPMLVYKPTIRQLVELANVPL